jgi:uncharacterized protein (TIGR00730 family)
MSRICVFCSSSERIDPRHRELAAAVGSELARRGHDLVSGGGRVSMMGAVAAAVRAGGRHTIGVIPEVLMPMEVADDDSDELVVVTDMRVRKARMDDEADAFLALPGGIGTLEELLEVWTAGSLGMHSKPVVVLDPDGVLAPLRALVDGLVASGFVRPEAAAVVCWARDVVDALDALEAGMGAPSGPVTATAEELLEAEP